MSTILFFDDWNLESYQNVRRVMGKPKWVEEATFSDAGFERSCFYPSVFWDAEAGLWRAFYIVWPKELENASALATAESSDGIHWREADVNAIVPDARSLRKNEVFPDGRGTESGTVYLDANESDPKRRYKLLYLPGTYREYVEKRGVHRLAVSADGYRWQPVEGVQWGDWLSDCPNCTYYNMHRGSYVTVCRPIWGDRRVALIETRDWKTWTEPEVVLHPEPADEPLLQYYGMPVFPYEGMYIGLLWLLHCDGQDIQCDKGRGPIDCQLAYSYNGWHYNRAFREAFVPLNDSGQSGSGCIYPGSIAVDSENRIRIYSNGTKTEHHKYRDYRNKTELLLHTLRLDGFMCMETTSGEGNIMTRCLVFRQPELKLNIEVPSGDARVQISDHSGKPIEGMSFGDCVAFTGDDLFWEPKWNSGKTLADALNRPVRVEVRMYRGKVYAIRGAFERTELMKMMRGEY